MTEHEGNTWANRIVGHGDVEPEQLLAHPFNARVHPLAQSQAVTGLLDAVGWVTEVTVNQRTGFVVDGHLRVAEAISRGEATIPVRYVELTDDEERMIVAYFDATGSLAVVDPTIFGDLTTDLEVPAGLESIHVDLSGITPDGGEVPDGDGDETPDANAMTWGYATYGKTKVPCSVAEVDALHGLHERYKEANGGLDHGFVLWLAGTDR